MNPQAYSMYSKGHASDPNAWRLPNLYSSYLARCYVLINSVIFTVQRSVHETPHLQTASSRTILRIGTNGVLDLQADSAQRTFDAHEYGFNETLNSSNTKTSTPLCFHCPNGIQGLLTTMVSLSKILLKSHHRTHHNHLQVHQNSSSWYSSSAS